MNAIALAMLLSELMLQFTEVSLNVHTILQRAQAEGRDVSDEELAQIKSARDVAVARFNAALSGQPGGGSELA